MALSVVLNGQPREFPGLNSPVPLDALVQELSLKGDRIAIERNGDIAERNRWPEIMVSTGDKLEVVHFVGGGGGN
jgi:sulfur carrier protein